MIYLVNDGNRIRLYKIRLMINKCSGRRPQQHQPEENRLNTNKQTKRQPTEIQRHSKSISEEIMRHLVILELRES